MAAPHWIELDGAANVRDLAGLPTTDGRTVRPDRLIRADNLQDLTVDDVRRLVDAHRVRTIVDLRTGVEVAAEGPGPLTHEPDVSVEHLSLFVEPPGGVELDDSADGPVVLPWQDNERRAERNDRHGVSGVYVGYLADRPDSVLRALRLIADEDGATVVHCAAGKDRTGVVVAIALAEVGVERDAIVADYAASTERIHGIVERLLGSDTYRHDVSQKTIDKHSPRPETMVRFLDAVDEEFGGVGAWLRQYGWTDEDARALRRSLLGD